MLKISSILLAGAAVTACAQQATPAGSPVASSPVAGGGECNIDGAQFALGRYLNAQLAAEAQIRSGALAVRVLQPGQMVTMEFNAQRLNLEVDAQGRVIRVQCG